VVEVDDLVEKPRIGVYICHCGTNIAGVISVEELRQYCEKLPNVVAARDYDYFCSTRGQEMIKDDIRKLQLNRVIVAACSPRLHEPTFRKVCEEAGLNPYVFEMANIREQDTWVHTKNPDEALQIAEDLLHMAVARAEKLGELEPKEVPVKRKALIIGGGIAGISAAIDLAESNFEVYMVEESPSIGGKMAQLDKTFPTMDCSSCILTPRMVDVSRHEKIKLLTYSEVKSVEGYVGNFKVTIVKKPRYVLDDKCNGCGKCVEVCPIEVPNEFDGGLSPRKAIYIPFPQAVPQVYTIDMDACVECDKCIEACHKEGLDAVDLNEKPEEIEIEVGTIIVASGYDVFDPTVIGEYGYGIYPNVLTALEMERILSASGPTHGDIIRPSDRGRPKSVAYVQCVGSRSKDTRQNPYCSRVCCMYAIKQARQIKEKYPDTDVYVFYTDLRCFGKGYEDFYWRAQEDGVVFVRGSLSSLWRKKGDEKLVVKAEDTLSGEAIELEFDMIVLSVGMTSSKGSDKLQKLLKIARSPDNFFAEAHPKLRPVDTFMDGVFICGAAQGPKDIPDAVAQAKAAASGAGALMSQGTFAIEPYFVIVNEDLCSGCGVCEAICPYNAIRMEEKTAKVEEILCKGCGSCSAACPTGAITAQHFTDTQILSQIKALVEGNRG
jgi:heterodisulfide reductase subunit A